MKNRTHWAAVLAALSATALVLTACSSSPGSTVNAPSGKTEQKTEQVKVAVLAPGSLQWLHAIAEARGFYADHGVSVQSIQVQNSSGLVQAVASGSADAGIALGDNVISAVDQGADVTITGALFQRAALRLYGAPGITKVSQLNGAPVTAGAVQGGTFDLLVYFLKKGGVDTSTITPVAIPNSSDRVVAMENGQVKGGLLIPPFDTLAERKGATLLATYDDFYVQTPSIVNRTWAKAHPDAARGFTQGLQDAAKWIAQKDNKAAAVDILAKYASVDKDAAGAAYDFLVGSKIFSPDLSVPEKGLTNIIAVSGRDVKNFEPKKYVDTQYLK